MTWVEHYLDDFITGGAPGSQECHSNLDLMKESRARLGAPVAGHKGEGPTTVLTFLSFELDTEQTGPPSTSCHSGAPRTVVCLAPHRATGNSSEPQEVGAPQCVYLLRSQVVAPVHGEVERDCHHAPVDTPSGVSGI